MIVNPETPKNVAGAVGCARAECSGAGCDQWRGEGMHGAMWVVSAIRFGTRRGAADMEIGWGTVERLGNVATSGI